MVEYDWDRLAQNMVEEERDGEREKEREGET